MRARLEQHRRRTRSDDGAISLELIGYVTVLVIVAMLCIQGLYVAQVTSAAQQAARSGARAQALGLDVSTEVHRQLPGWAQVQAISTSYPGDGVRVEVAVRVPIVLPGITSRSFSVTRDAVLPRG